ncbi:Trafficking protein particle complex subunit 2-like protein [Phytophthora pseudosyringae]|uniref:Trafficking protein particle complex subunit 2-like protein n=1 Tax=Phytophthora pseudosyringae TaxID=221518 RepID=A0A8T1VY81_9STRA|nr:Trafficking protein particle complex subunit 2-like protein [Phytophthora pseudosyringae]
MARRVMSRRGNSASQPQVTPYQQIELDDGWREWENTKQELVLVKRQVAEKDALILQLKTASRRLQETLRKKDKDLQAAFAILRSPQDAKTTKTRKQELVDRLVSECMQRLFTHECGSKFLRFQELEIEIEECRTEIERLRAKLETTSVPSPTAVVGKLKVSSIPLTGNDPGSITGALMKKTKLDPLNLPENESPDSRQTANVPAALSVTRIHSTQSTSGQVRVVPLTKYDHREGFVSKTRRRALEAEYYKQVRLAQLEVECELEENLHIRAAREARKLKSIGHQGRQTEIAIDTGRSQQAALDVAPGNNDPSKTPGAEGVEPSNAHDDSAHVDGDSGGLGQEELPSQQANDRNVQSADTTETEVAKSLQPSEFDASEEGSAKSVEQAETIEQGVSEKPVTSTTEEMTEEGGEHQETNGHVQSKQKTYANDEFDASDDDTNDNFKEADSVWNVDPNPRNNDQPDGVESSSAGLEQPIGATNNTESAVWNVDPNPSDSTETEFRGEGGADRVVWNTDPHAAGADVSMDDAPIVYSDNEDDVHNTAVEQEHPVRSDGNSVWNLDPSPTVPTDEKLADAMASYEGEVLSGKESMQEEESNVVDDSGESKIWNLDPTPASDPAQVATTIEDARDIEHPAEVIQPVWNLDPEPAAEAVSSPELPRTQNDANEEVPAGAIEEENADADSSIGEDPNPSNAIHASDPTVEKEQGESPWNLDPNSSPSPTLSKDDDDKEPVQSAGVPAHDEAGTENAEPDRDITDNEADTNNAWNLNPSVLATAPEHVDEGRGSPSGEEESETSVWNLDPHSGDASEPIDSATEVAATEFVQEDENVSTVQSATGENVNDGGGEGSRDKPAESSNEPETPAFDEGAGPDDDMAEAEHTTEDSNPSSPRESEDDATPEYTPPSTARDSDAAADDDDDTTW